jgi:hypothetical protein
VGLLRERAISFCVAISVADVVTLGGSFAGGKETTPSDSAAGFSAGGVFDFSGAGFRFTITGSRTGAGDGMAGAGGYETRIIGDAEDGTTLDSCRTGGSADSLVFVRSKRGDGVTPAKLGEIGGSQLWDCGDAVTGIAGLGSKARIVGLLAGGLLD